LSKDVKVEGVPFIADGLRLAENEMFFHVADIHGGRYDFDSTHHSPTRGSGFGGRNLTRLEIPTRGSCFGGRSVAYFGGKNFSLIIIFFACSTIASLIGRSHRLSPFIACAQILWCTSPRYPCSRVFSDFEMRKDKFPLYV